MVDKNTLTFARQGFSVHWVSFTLSSSDEQKQKLISSFHGHGFNFYLLDKSIDIINADVIKKSKRPIFVNNAHSLQALLVDYLEVTSLVIR